MRSCASQSARQKLVFKGGFSALRLFITDPDKKQDGEFLKEAMSVSFFLGLFSVSHRNQSIEVLDQ
jgi:hypothetical protein